MKIYLDNNIFIDIEDGKYSVNDLKNLLDVEDLDIYYSQAHISEAHEMSGYNRTYKIKNRLKSISAITKNNYVDIDQLTQNPFLTLLSPKESMRRLEYWNKIYNVKERQKSFMNTVTQEQKEAFRLVLGVETKELNNYTYLEVLAHLEAKKAEFQNKTLSEFIETASFLVTRKAPTFADKLAGTFELLDLIGYWKDSYTEKSNFARHQDGMHSYYASKCDYFITNDKRTMNKAKVVYQIYGIETKAISTKP